MLRVLKSLLRDETASAMVEYAIVAAALAVPALAASSSIENAASAALTGMTGGLQSVGANPP